MVSLTHLLTFFFILAFVLFLGYSSVPAQGSIAQQANATMNNMNALSASMNSSISIQTNMPLLGTIVFPNVFAIFYGIFNTLWSMLNIPTTLLGGIGLPPIILVGLGGVLVLILALTVIDWFKH